MSGYFTRTIEGRVERCAPVQGDSRWDLPTWHPRRPADAQPPGSISWEEHLEAYAEYSRRFGRDQSAERLAERGGFGHDELRTFLGRLPTTFQARVPR